MFAFFEAQIFGRPSVVVVKCYKQQFLFDRRMLSFIFRGNIWQRSVVRCVFVVRVHIIETLSSFRIRLLILHISVRFVPSPFAINATHAIHRLSLPSPYYNLAISSECYECKTATIVCPHEQYKLRVPNFFTPDQNDRRSTIYKENLSDPRRLPLRHHR